MRVIERVGRFSMGQFRGVNSRKRFILGSAGLSLARAECPACFDQSSVIGITDDW